MSKTCNIIIGKKLSASPIFTYCVQDRGRGGKKLVPPRIILKASNLRRNNTPTLLNTVKKMAFIETIIKQYYCKIVLDRVAKFK